MKRKVTKIPKMAMSTIWASRMTIIGSARSINCHSFMVIMERARNISREMLEIMASSGSFKSSFSLWSAIFLRIAAAVMAPTEAGNSTPVFSRAHEIRVPMPTVRSTW